MVGAGGFVREDPLNSMTAKILGTTPDASRMADSGVIPTHPGSSFDENELETNSPGPR
jgi:hypothetical protein